VLELNNFNKLSLEEKKQLVWEHGIYIDSKVSKYSAVTLFLVGDYYVEMFLNRISEDIEEIRAFDEVDNLEIYLKEINIDGLL
jgi:hypothetical protein